jgi:hypothetical protein
LKALSAFLEKKTHIILTQNTFFPLPTLLFDIICIDIMPALNLKNLLQKFAAQCIYF